jgi:hypothetical protein
MKDAISAYMLMELKYLTSQPQLTFALIFEFAFLPW